MSPNTYSALLKDRGFFCFFSTQFLGAFNDNFYKIIITFVALDMPGGGNQYISLIGALFILPFLLFSGYAGHLADVYSKRTILIAVKIFEVAAMVMGLLAFLWYRIEPMLAVVFLMGLHSTVFSPAKYGILPEMLEERELSRGNGLLEMSTFMAIILGTSLGGGIYEAWNDRLPWIGLVLITIAAVGILTSVGITRVPPSGAAKKLTLNPFAEIARGTRILASDGPLRFAVLGISYFWFLGALLQMIAFPLGKETLQLGETQTGLLFTFTALGIGAGSLVAGRLSGDQIELGLVPIGSIGMAAFCVLLFAAGSFYSAAGALVLLGYFGGFFAVPLNALLQQRSGREDKGRVIATNNVFNTLGVLIAAGLFWLLNVALEIRPEHIVLIIGVLTFVFTGYVLYVAPDFFVRFVLWSLTHTLYRIRIVGDEHIPRSGPALLVSNHVSFVDAFLIGASVQRFVRFMLHRDYYDLRLLNPFFRMMNVIPVSSRRRGIIDSLRRARKELAGGHVVCIFAEGAISRLGHLLPFRRGFEKIVEGTDVPVIPVHLDQLWGSVFSFKDGRFFWKWPRRLPYTVTVSFGKPLPATADAQRVRQAVLELESDAAYLRPSAHDLLHGRFIRTAKRRWFSFCAADSTGAELSFGKALIAALLFSRWIRGHCAAQESIGILLPASVGGLIVNAAVVLAGKTPVNLNFTAGREAMLSAIKQCGINTILTSRVFRTKAEIEELPGMEYLEEIRKRFGAGQKLAAACAAFLLPGALLRRRYARQQPHDRATVIFSSGSTGAPKGIVLSHRNILSNIESIGQVIHFNSTDRIVGMLPFFHSFGFAITLWLPLVEGVGAVYHPNPMDAKTIGEMTEKHHGTILISTPTFYASYTRRCAPEQFASLRYAIAGAEKLRPQIARDFREKFGMELLEGYGCTEMSPVVAVNVPDVVYGSERQIGNKPGTIGRPIPGVAVKVVDLDSARPLAPGQEGMLLAKGPNRMLGYLNRPDLTAEVIRDGWYVTGDVAAIDEDGFIRITDRLARFSKIGGEMVPHAALEEAINEVLGHSACVVTAVPDERKGEQLVVFHSENGVSSAQLWEKLNQSALPKLWLPKRENIHHIEAIPVLGSGKVDLRAVKAMALGRRDSALS